MESIAAILEQTAARARALTDRARQALLMGRNAKALIHRLPVEVLSMIFHTAAYFGDLNRFQGGEPWLETQVKQMVEIRGSR